MLIVETNSQPTDPRDVARLTDRLLTAGRLHHLDAIELGRLGERDCLLLLKPRTTGVINLLVAAGFHGEEPAGCWGILEYLERTLPVSRNDVAVAWLPIVNPTGIRRGIRYNDWGENPNSAFCHVEDQGESLSKEGVLLVKHLTMLKALAHDGFISLHEDIDFSEFYLYTFEQAQKPGAFSQTLIDAAKKHFLPCPDSIVEGGQVLDGTVFKQCDGSFEDRLFHEGIPRTACTETPGKLDLSLRIKANADIIESFIRYHASLPSSSAPA